MDILKELRTVRDAKARERELIRDARIAGYDWATICEAAGVTRPTAIFYAKAANGGENPVPTRHRGKPVIAKSDTKA